MMYFSLSLHTLCGVYVLLWCYRCMLFKILKVDISYQFQLGCFVEDERVTLDDFAGFFWRTELQHSNSFLKGLLIYMFT